MPLNSQMFVRPFCLVSPTEDPISTKRSEVFYWCDVIHSISITASLTVKGYLTLNALCNVEGVSKDAI